jgi:hypothetical protein
MKLSCPAAVHLPQFEYGHTRRLPCKVLLQLLTQNLSYSQGQLAIGLHRSLWYDYRTLQRRTNTIVTGLASSVYSLYITNEYYFRLATSFLSDGKVSDIS